MSDPIRELEIAEAQLTRLRTELATMAELYASQREILTTVAAERDALRMQRDALQVDRSKTVKLRDETDNVIWSLKPEDVPGAINWGDLVTRETQEVIDEQRRWYRVIIEEADPANPALHAAVLAGLVAKGWKADDIEIETAW